jgi:hypothetical protein
MGRTALIDCSKNAGLLDCGIFEVTRYPGDSIRTYVFAVYKTANLALAGFVRNWRASQNKTANTYVIDVAL